MQLAVASMTLVKWNESLSVGVKAMDDQHMSLMDALNDLSKAVMNGETTRVTGPLVHKMAQYVRDHFSAEEAMMRATAFPGLAEHSAKHNELTARVRLYVDRFEHGEISLNLHLLNLMREWLTAHIRDEDRKYAPWLSEHGENWSSFGPVLASQSVSLQR
jgi:hemerythrin